MLKRTHFTKDPRVVALLKQLKKHPKPVSDTLSINPKTNETVEYVDLVQEGGGMLGIALVGYIYVLEQMGIRFRSIAGASAGAINATLMYGIGYAHEAKAEKLLDIIATKNFFDFVDGNFFVRFCFRLITAKFKLFALVGIPLLCIYWIFIGYWVNRFGLNRGDKFQEWIHTLLQQNGVETVAEMEAQRSHFQAEPLQLRKERATESQIFNRRLVLIASDISTQTKVEFPQYAPLYWMHPEKAQMADFVRASMAIPFFFRPFEKNNIYGNIPLESQRNLWKALINGLITPNFDTFDDANVAKQLDRLDKMGILKEMPVPKSVKMVDGGLLSNFPINVFHNNSLSVPRMPTFGIKLGMELKQAKETNLLVKFLGAMFATIRQLYDDDFLQKNPDYTHLITFIDTNNFNWLNFNMKEEEKIELFVKGAEAAARFYEGFDWESYKTIRKQAYQTAFGISLNQDE